MATAVNSCEICQITKIST